MIFIVDDDRSVRSSLSRLMRSAGYKSLAFASAEEYLDAAGAAFNTSTSDNDSDCIILDLHMSGMGGLELLEIVKRREPPVPVVVLTATEDPEMRFSASAAGAKNVLRKPCDSATLIRAVADATGRSPRGGGGIPQAALHADGNPAGFELERGHGTYRPVGQVSFEELVAMVRAVIAAARRNHLGDLLVDTTALTGFPSPDTFERFLATVEWAEEAAGGIRLAMVARPDLIHPQKLGVLVALNHGFVSNIFASESEAREWLRPGAPN